MGSSQAPSEHTKQVMLVGGACFLAGIGAHIAFLRLRSKPFVSQPQHVSHTAASPSTVAGSEAAVSLPSTPRGADGVQHKMALLVRSDMQLGQGRLGSLTAHAALLQYKKLYRRKDPNRLPWEQESMPKICLEVSSDQQLVDCRAAAKSAGCRPGLWTLAAVDGTLSECRIVNGGSVSRIFSGSFAPRSSPK